MRLMFERGFLLSIPALKIPHNVETHTIVGLKHPTVLSSTSGLIAGDIYTLEEPTDMKNNFRTYMHLSRDAIIWY